MVTPLLSIVIPAYNEQSRIKQCILDLKSFFSRFGSGWEALIVVEKSNDDTFKVAKAAIDDCSNIKLIYNNVHLGKGYAVKTGMLNAIGEYVFYMDVDLSTPLVEVVNFLAEAQADPSFDLLIGDRKNIKSKIIKRQNYFRQKAGEFFNFLVQLLVLKGIKDTQCGFKMFKKQSVKLLFENLKTYDFAFDVEILLRAKKLGFKVKSMPVQWINSKHSKVHFIKDSIKMFFSILRLYIRGV
ncbi:MAG: glycosyltransferase [Oligoflexia bacterium]|nr:glycosyltransferase [Oligoflexia bacterium]